MDALLDKFYFAAAIKTVRNVHAMCRKIDITTNQAELLAIARIIADELAPTVAYANCYDRASVVKEFGIEMNNKIEAFLAECMHVDCNAASGACVPVSQNTLEPTCTRVEILWDEIVEIYCKKLCPLGWIGKSIKMKMLECRIEKAVPRPLPYSENGVNNATR